MWRIMLILNFIEKPIKIILFHLFKYCFQNAKCHYTVSYTEKVNQQYISEIIVFITLAILKTEMCNSTKTKRN